MPLLTVDGLQFKGLNRNGKLDVYEDWRQTPEARADDLLKQMTVEDMAGTMLHGTLPVVGGPFPSLGTGGNSYDFAKTRELIVKQGITAFLTRFIDVTPGPWHEVALGDFARFNEPGMPNAHAPAGRSTSVLPALSLPPFGARIFRHSSRGVLPSAVSQSPAPKTDRVAIT